MGSTLSLNFLSLNSLSSSPSSSYLSNEKEKTKREKKGWGMFFLFIWVGLVVIFLEFSSLSYKFESIVLTSPLLYHISNGPLSEFKNYDTLAPKLAFLSFPSSHLIIVLCWFIGFFGLVMLQFNTKLV